MIHLPILDGLEMDKGWNSFSDGVGVVRIWRCKTEVWDAKRIWEKKSGERWCKVNMTMTELLCNDLILISSVPAVSVIGNFMYKIKAVIKVPAHSGYTRTLSKSLSSGHCPKKCTSESQQTN